MKLLDYSARPRSKGAAPPPPRQRSPPAIKNKTEIGSARGQNSGRIRPAARRRLARAKETATRWLTRHHGGAEASAASGDDDVARKPPPRGGRRGPPAAPSSASAGPPVGAGTLRKGKNKNTLRTRRAPRARV